MSKGYVHENIIICYEILHNYRHNKGLLQMSLKIDLHNTYDYMMGLFAEASQGIFIFYHYNQLDHCMYLL